MNKLLKTITDDHGCTHAIWKYDGRYMIETVDNVTELSGDSTWINWPIFYLDGNWGLDYPEAFIQPLHRLSDWTKLSRHNGKILKYEIKRWIELHKMITK